MNLSLLVQEVTKSLIHQSDLGLDFHAARFEARLLITFVLDKPRYYLDAHPEWIPSEELLKNIKALVARRLAGEPIAYLFGAKEFFGREFNVNQHVLIPRPETELIIERVLAVQDPTMPCQILDLGTGSGCIAITLALECPHAQVMAVDMSPQALIVAQANTRKWGATVTWLQSHWFEELAQHTPPYQFDWIVSNPPYIAEADPHLNMGDVRFEPRTALTSGSDGLTDLNHIIFSATKYLKTKGKILLEHGYDQHKHVQALLKENGFVEVMSYCDLAGIPRVTQGQWNGVLT